MYRYRVIAEELENSFREMGLTQGARTPSVRDLCKMYDCHQTTAMKALNYLKDKGVLYSIPQSGFYITGQDDSVLMDNKVIDFESSSPDSRFFPYKDYQKCVNLAIEKNRSSLFEYSDLSGYLPLKKAIAKLVTNDYIFAEAKNIVITTGIQQGLSLLSEINMSNCKHKILIEQPTYHRYIEYLKLNLNEVVTIDRTFNGIDLIALEKAFSTGEIKFFYTMPRVHNPLGTSLSKSEKEKLIELAYKYDVYIVEDDYMGDYVIDKSNDPLITYDFKKTHVIYLRSFSKIVFPGLRVGFAILPQVLTNEFAEKKYYRDMGTSLLAQASLEIYLKNKMYDRHVSKMRKLYAKRAISMISILSSLQVKGSYSANSDSPIIHTCLDGVRSYSLTKLESYGFKVADIRKYYYIKNKALTNYLLINVSNVDEKQIKIGIRKLLLSLEK